MDRISTEARSRIMSAIRGKGNRSTEKRLRALLAAHGISGWRLHPPGLPGKPDFLFPAARVIVFVDGCFWHGCEACCNIPSTNRRYWRPKLRRNRERDERNTALLISLGWRVLRLWEHELRDGAAAIGRVRAVIAAACPTPSPSRRAPRRRVS